MKNLDPRIFVIGIWVIIFVCSLAFSSYLDYYVIEGPINWTQNIICGVLTVLSITIYAIVRAHFDDDIDFRFSDIAEIYRSTIGQDNENKNH